MDFINYHDFGCIPHCSDFDTGIIMIDAGTYRVQYLHEGIIKYITVEIEANDNFIIPGGFLPTNQDVYFQIINASFELYEYLDRSTFKIRTVITVSN